MMTLGALSGVFGKPPEIIRKILYLHFSEQKGLCISSDSQRSVTLKRLKNHFSRCCYVYGYLLAPGAL